MTALRVAAVPIDLQTLTASLRTSGALDRVGGAVAVNHLVDSCTSSAHVEHYARIVATKSELREIFARANQIAVKACSDDADPSLIAFGGEKAFAEIYVSRVGIPDLVDVATIIDAGSPLRIALFSRTCLTGETRGASSARPRRARHSLAFSSPSALRPESRFWYGIQTESCACYTGNYEVRPEHIGRRLIQAGARDVFDWARHWDRGRE
jgi:hypothetical protein